MAALGYALSSEEHAPGDLVRFAQAAEESGLTFALISDHFHPWVSAQGHSGFVWALLGGIAQATDSIVLGTGVTCPTMRTHPAIIAHAAATVSTMMPGRFFLGVGSGENLNEHVTGEQWPSVSVRQEMLEEAIEVIRDLWEGGMRDHHGAYYVVEQARIFDLPDQPTPLMVAAAGPDAAGIAARLGDGLIATKPDAELLTAYRDAGGRGPRFGQLTVCWASSEQEALDLLKDQWPNAAMGGDLGQEVKSPEDYDAIAELVRPEDFKGKLPAGPDVGAIIDAIRTYERAGFDHIYLHQIGPDQEDFLRMVEQEVVPELKPGEVSLGSRAGAAPAMHL